MAVGRQTLNDFSDALNVVSKAARDDLSSFIDQLDFENAYDASCGLLRDHVKQLVNVYGDAASELGANYVEAMAGADGTSGLVLADTLSDDIIDKGIGFGLRKSLPNGTDILRDNLSGKLDAWVKQAGRDTVTNWALKDQREHRDVRYARVPRGAHTCPWCNMLASRGFVYLTPASAVLFGKAHPYCDCQIVRGYAGMEIDGYDPARLYGQYLDDLKSGNLTINAARSGGSSRGHASQWTSDMFKSMGDFERYIDEATSMEDLQERCAVATDEWKKATLSDKYWNELKQTVRIKRSALQAADANAARSA
jgi:hypothetical protein